MPARSEALAPALPALALPGLGAITAKRPVAFAALFTLIACAFLEETAHLDPLPRFLALALMPAGLLLGGRAGRACFAGAAACFVFMLWDDWFVMANHGFVITYFTLFLAVTWTTRPDFWVQGEVFARAMLMILMGFALVQKLASAYYMSGNQFADMLLGGESYLALLTLLDPAAAEAVKGALAAEAALAADHALQAAGGAAPLPELPFILLLAIHGMTWGALALQGGLELALVWRERCGIWLHRLIFLFTLTVYTLRPENIFLACNLLMGYALTDERSRAMRLPYVLLIGWFVLSAVAGLRPGLIR